jgi:hypothetical protein
MSSGRERASHGPGLVEAWKPPGACIPENGSGLGSLVDVYKWCVLGAYMEASQSLDLTEGLPDSPDGGPQGPSPAVWAGVPLQV